VTTARFVPFILIVDQLIICFHKLFVNNKIIRFFTFDVLIINDLFFNYTVGFIFDFTILNFGFFTLRILSIVSIDCLFCLRISFRPTWSSFDHFGVEIVLSCIPCTHMIIPLDFTNAFDMIINEIII